MDYCQKHMGFKNRPSIEFHTDDENAKKLLGKTAYYSPDEKKIVIFISNRHPKDILRSLAHELVHHNQNCNGMFNKPSSNDINYAQKDPHLRNMEKEAYLLGNMLFRDWEDGIKVSIKAQLKENIRMNENKLKELIKKELEEGVAARRKQTRKDAGTPRRTFKDFEADNAAKAKREEYLRKRRAVQDKAEEEYYKDRYPRLSIDDARQMDRFSTNPGPDYAREMAGKEFDKKFGGVPKIGESKNNTGDLLMDGDADTGNRRTRLSNLVGDVILENGTYEMERIIEEQRQQL